MALNLRSIQAPPNLVPVIVEPVYGQFIDGHVRGAPSLGLQNMITIPNGGWNPGFEVDPEYAEVRH